MRARALALAVLALAPLASALDPAGAPALRVGDSWTYEIVDDAGARVATTMTRVAEVETHRTATGPVQVVRVESETRAGETLGRVTTWVRASDAAVLRSLTNQSRSDGSRTLTLVQEVDYTAPCPSYGWPLTVGATWNSTCTLTRTTYVPGDPPRTQQDTQDTQGRVVREERVETQAGAFDAFVIETMTESGPIRQHYAPSACQPVRVEQQGLTMTLTAFACAATGASAASGRDAPGAAAVVALVGLAIGVLLRRRS